MTFNLFSTTRKKRSLMYGRVAKPIQKSFFQILWRLLQSRMDNLSDYVIPFVFFFQYSGAIKQYLLISFVSKNTTNFFHFLQITSN